MVRALRFLSYLTLAAVAAWGGYVVGWYRGLTYHSVVASMSEAKWSMSVARSIRNSEPELALELLEANINWTDMSLRNGAQDVPKDERGNYEIVMRRLREYRQEFAEPPLPRPGSEQRPTRPPLGQ